MVEFPTEAFEVELAFEAERYELTVRHVVTGQVARASGVPPAHLHQHTKQLQAQLSRGACREVGFSPENVRVDVMRAKHPSGDVRDLHRWVHVPSGCSRELWSARASDAPSMLHALWLEVWARGFRAEPGS